MHNCKNAWMNIRIAETQEYRTIWLTYEVERFKVVWREVSISCQQMKGFGSSLGEARRELIYISQFIIVRVAVMTTGNE